MRVPSPFNTNENQILVERFIGKVTIPFALLPTSALFNPGDIEALNTFADKIAAKPKAYLDAALQKISENHFREHQRINPGSNCSEEQFRTGLELQNVSVWPDGAWGMVFQSSIGILGNNVVFACFPSKTPSFTSLIAD